MLHVKGTDMGANSYLDESITPHYEYTQYLNIYEYMNRWTIGCSMEFWRNFCLLYHLPSLIVFYVQVIGNFVVT